MILFDNSTDTYSYPIILGQDRESVAVSGIGEISMQYTNGSTIIVDKLTFNPSTNTLENGVGGNYDGGVFKVYYN